MTAINLYTIADIEMQLRLFKYNRDSMKRYINAGVIREDVSHELVAMDAMIDKAEQMLVSLKTAAVLQVTPAETNGIENTDCTVCGLPYGVVHQHPKPLELKTGSTYRVDHEGHRLHQQKVVLHHLVSSNGGGSGGSLAPGIKLPGISIGGPFKAFVVVNPASIEEVPAGYLVECD